MKKFIFYCIVWGHCWTSVLLATHPSFKKMLSYEEQRNRNPIELCHSIISDIPECNFLCSNGNVITKDDFMQHTFLKKKPLISIDELIYLVRTITSWYNNNLKSSHARWVNESGKKILTQTLSQGFYAQAITVPQDATIIAMGDYHGCAHSLARNILSLHQEEIIDEQGVLRPNNYIVFLGDLADRGFYGIECWALAIILKLKNPYNVIILQGNHEYDRVYKTGGLTAEFEYKYTECPDYLTDASFLINFGFEMFFSLLPQLFFIGTRAHERASYRFVQYCHGGIHTFADQQTKAQDNNLIDFKTQKEFDQDMNAYVDLEDLFIDAICAKAEQLSCLMVSQGPRISGYTWNGFYSNINGVIYGKRKGSRGVDVLFHGREVLSYLEKISIPGLYDIQGIVRGHDHMQHAISWLHPFSLNSSQWSTQQSWKPIIYTPSKPEYLEDARHARHLLFTDENHGYPVCTITSLASLQKTDAYGIITFDRCFQAWLLTPHIRNAPFCEQELTSQAYWSYSEICGHRDHELINFHLINQSTNE